MSQKIDLDHGRFRQIIRGKIKQNLRKYISQGEMIARKGKDTVAIPLPQVEIPHFKHGGKQQGGVGQGDGEVGDSLGGDGDEQPGAGQAGDRPGDHLLDVEVSLQELAEIMGEELELPRIQPKGTEKIVAWKDKYSGIRTTGPESLRHFRRTFRQDHFHDDRLRIDGNIGGEHGPSHRTLDGLCCDGHEGDRQCHEPNGDNKTA